MKKFLILGMLASCANQKPKTIHEDEIKVVDWGNEKIRLKGVSKEFRPVEFHFKQDGSIYDKPMIAIVFDDLAGERVYGQVSLAMLEPFLKHIEKMKKEGM